VSGLGRYGRILRARHVVALSITALVARLPIGVVSLSIVLFLREETGSYAIAGAVAAAFALGSGAAAPVAGRLVDRLGRTRVLLPLAVINAAALLALVRLGLEGAPTAALLVVGLVAGACVPPVSAVLRTLWPGLLGKDRDELLPTAFALDSVIIELVFTIGPLLAAGVSAFASPAAALVLSAFLTVAGTAAFMALPPTRAAMPEPPMPDGGEQRTRNRLGALAAPGLRTIVLATLPIGFTFGATEVTLPAFAEDMGSPELGGVGIAVWSAASAAGGLYYGARPGDRPLPERFVRLSFFLALAFLPLAAAPNFLVMLPLLLVAGAFIAPSLAAGNQLAGDVAPRGTETEAFTWPVTSLVVGVALGNAAAGAVVEFADWRTSFLCATIGAATGAAVLRLRRRTLVPLRPALV
jgi:MFS family permease